MNRFIARKAYCLTFMCLLFLSLPVKAQQNYPQDAFRSPMDIPLILAGTFGELRSNHFHSGIDIKTQQREGLPIYVIGDGSVTRIKISLWGYGKAIYVAHPNGYTSVYGHLQKFSPEIEAYIKKAQYAKKSYEIELFPALGELTVGKSDVIAYGGNTGGSSGPHLHFEIRSSITEKPTNPLLYGLEVRDATNPILEKIFAYPLSEDAVVNQSKNKVELRFSRQADGTLLANKVYAHGKLGIGFKGFDRQDLAANKNGVYSVTLSANGKTYTDYDFETFSFGETRYINTLIDYDHFGAYRQRIHQCFKAPGNKLNIYNTLVDDGQITIEEGLSYSITLLLKDIAGNETKAIIPVQGKKEAIKKERLIRKTDDFLMAKRNNNYDLGGAKVYFPANTFYDDFFIDLQKGQDTIRIHNDKVAAHRNFTITFDVARYSQEERTKLFIARIDKKGKPKHLSTFKRGNTFTARTRNLGTYTLVKDTEPPSVKPKNFKEKEWLNNYSYLSIQIADDLSGIKTYDATLNGEWILMEYEPKRKPLTYNFDDKILNKKECTLEVIVTDNVGNKTTFNSHFFRK